MRVLLATSAEKGHLNPMVGVAQWLVKLGHRVGWLTLPEPLPELARLGVEIVPVVGLPRGPDLETGGEALARLVRDPPALRSWIRALLLDAVPGQVEPVRAAVGGFRPDVVALDGMLYAAAIASQLEGISWAGVSSALTLLEPPEFDSELLRTVRALSPERAELFESYGLAPDFRTCECLSPRLNAIFATGAFVGDAPLPPATELLGPSIPLGARGDEPEFPWEELPADRPLVYASFGSQIYWQPELLGRIADAIENVGAALVISAGELAGSRFAADLPGRPLVRPYVPQLALLERAAVIVTHGGANSVMESLRFGVPQLLVPICNDQPLQAFFAERVGTGVAVAPELLTAARCRAALEQLLQPDGAPRRAALRVAEDYRRCDGAQEAARRIAAMAS